MSVFRLSEAADLLGVSYDTVRRWADSGRLAISADQAGRRVIDGTELARFCTATAEPESGEDRPGIAQSARNRFPGIVTKVTRDTVMAQVEIQAGPHRVVSLMSREACDELGLEPGARAAAVVKATNVVVEIPER